jgi:hypothetical protein
LTEALPVPPAMAMTIAGMAKKLRHHPARCGPLGERLDLYQIENTIRPLGLLDKSMSPTRFVGTPEAWAVSSSRPSAKSAPSRLLLA